MSRFSHRPFGRPDPLTYLNNVKASFGNADSSTFHIFLSEVDAWIGEQNSDLDFKRLGRIAALLRFKPHLLQGFNALLRPNHRLECSTNVTEVRYLVFVTPKVARIISPTQWEVPFPASDAELRSLVLLKTWRGLLDSCEKDWLVCIGALLQVILDDPATDPICYRRACSCLNELAKDSILPPSVLVNNLKLELGQAAQLGEAFADIYKGAAAGFSMRFRVLHMFDKNMEKNENLYKDLYSEAITWRQLNHPNVVPFIGVNTELFSPRFCFISLWASNGDLMSYLKQHPEHDRFNSICEIVDGIHYLHNLDPPLAHKDIKAANVHVNDRLICCLTDFGLSLVVKSQPFHRQLRMFQGSVCWTAPEVMDPARSQEQDPQAGDIYSLACTIYEVYTGSPPLFSTHKLPTNILPAVLAGERPELPPPGTWIGDEEEMWWLVGHCWADKPQDRPNIDLVKHALRDIRTSKLTTTDILDTSNEDARELTTNLDAVKTWLEDEAIGSEKILFNYLNLPRSSSNVSKLDCSTGLPNALFRSSIAMIEYSSRIAETSASLNSSPTTSEASDDSSSLPTPSSKTDSLPTPPPSPVSSHEICVVSPSGLRVDAPPYIPLRALKVSTPPLSAMRATALPFVPTCRLEQNNPQPEQENGSQAPLHETILDNLVDTTALRRFLVQKLTLHSRAHRRGGCDTSL